MKKWTVEIPESFWEKRAKDYWCSGLSDGKYNLEITPMFPDSLEGKKSTLLAVRFGFIAPCETPLIIGKWYHGYIRNERQSLHYYYATHHANRKRELFNEIIERSRNTEFVVCAAQRDAKQA